MSAFLTVLQHDRVSMLTDAAVLDRDGRLIGTHQKIIPAAEGIATVRGEHSVGIAFARRIEACSRLDELVGSVHRILGDVEQDCSDLGERRRHYEIAICGWLDGPRVWFIAGHDLDDERWKLREITAPVFGGGPTPDEDVLASIGFQAPTDPSDFDAGTHGLKYIEAMRRTSTELPFAKDKRRHFIVGGYAYLATVTAKGIEQRTICKWPDRTSRRIDPWIDGLGREIAGPDLCTEGNRRP